MIPNYSHHKVRSRTELRVVYRLACIVDFDIRKGFYIEIFEYLCQVLFKLM